MLLIKVWNMLIACFGEGNGTLLQYSCLENLRDGGAWWAAVYGVAQSRTRLKRLSSSSSNSFLPQFRSDLLNMFFTWDSRSEFSAGNPGVVISQQSCWEFELLEYFLLLMEMSGFFSLLSLLPLESHPTQLVREVIIPTAKTWRGNYFKLKKNFLKEVVSGVYIL